jgi:3-hydroxybutyryl-CoA dehydrogenase
VCHQKETGFPIGPFELGNLIGFDVLSYVHEELGEPYYAPRESSRSSCAGRLGQKSGRGFYAYPEEP